jgi:hypothetical protein
MVLLALSAAILPAQFDPEITEGAAGRVLIVATTGVRGLLSQAALLKVTKKVVVADNEGSYLWVISPPVLVDTSEPELLYHLKVPDSELVADSVTMPGPQFAPGTGVGAGGGKLMVAFTGVRRLTQPLGLVKVT